MALIFTPTDLVFLTIILLIAIYVFYIHLQVAEHRGRLELGEFAFRKGLELERELVSLQSCVEIAKEAKQISQNTQVELEAIKKSTHTVIPVGGKAEMDALEKKFRQVTGTPAEDFTTDLESLGFKSGNNTQNAEDLV